MSKIYIAPICHWCKHYQNIMRNISPPKCKAFPNGIPEDIWELTTDHRQIVDGDRSIQFEQIEDMNNVGEELKLYLYATGLSSETALRMAFDKIDEQDEWRLDNTRYLEIKSDEDN